MAGQHVPGCPLSRTLLIRVSPEPGEDVPLRFPLLAVFGVLPILSLSWEGSAIAAGRDCQDLSLPGMEPQSQFPKNPLCPIWLC